MSIVSIICEYNPFHTGHQYQINKIKSLIRDAKILCLMSGNFVQRGDASILDKHTRAKIALKNGADLVLEMPCLFSTQVAPIFANGSISILNSLNTIDYLCFGSETGNLDALKKIAKNSFLNKNILKAQLKSGKSYIKSYSSISNVPSTSNDILGIEYIKAMINTNSSITPYTILREGSAYNDTSLSEKYSSATAIRHFFKTKIDEKKSILNTDFNFLMQNSIEYFDEKYLKFDEDFFKYIKYAIIMNEKNLKNIFEISEGLENLIISNIKKADTLNQLIMMTKSKRYTYTRIRRIMFNILLNITKQDIVTIKENYYKSPYVRILGFNENGREILKEIKQRSDIELINKTSLYTPKDEYSKLFFEKDIKATQIYNIEKKSYYYNDFLTSPIKLWFKISISK